MVGDEDGEDDAAGAMCFLLVAEHDSAWGRTVTAHSVAAKGLKPSTIPAMHTAATITLVASVTSRPASGHSCR